MMQLTSYCLSQCRHGADDCALGKWLPRPGVHICTPLLIIVNRICDTPNGE